MVNINIQIKNYGYNFCSNFVTKTISKVSKILNPYKLKFKKTQRTIDFCIQELLKKIDEKDKYTTTHCLEVANLAELFARRLQLTEEKVRLVKNAALLHDIGKIEIPQNILEKTSCLSKEERSIIKNHSLLGVKKIEKEYPELKAFIPAIKYHHEAWNGKGYPANLSGDEIPIEAQIISIADCYHAILGRNYSKNLSPYEACKTLLNGAGSQWNPYLVFKFVKFIMSSNTQQTI